MFLFSYLFSQNSLMCLSLQASQMKVTQVQNGVTGNLTLVAHKNTSQKCSQWQNSIDIAATVLLEITRP
jgi:hypothetical protein